MAGKSRYVRKARIGISNTSTYVDGKRINDGTMNKFMDVMYGREVRITNGACRWHRICGSHNVQPPKDDYQKISAKIGWLGNGLCMDCWDNGGRPKTKQGRRRFTKAQREDYMTIDALLKKTKEQFYSGKAVPNNWQSRIDITDIDSPQVHTQ